MNNKKWQELSPKEMCGNYINHVYDDYYKSYSEESDKFERINNLSHLVIVIIGFLVTILLGLKEKIIFKNDNYNLIITIITFCLPSISSVLLMYTTQRGFKAKELLRENARIICKYYVNEAKIQFSNCKADADYINLYQWLNTVIKELQLNQSKGYFSSQDGMNK